MKKVPFLIVLILFFFLNLNVLVYSANSTDLNETDAGITPESPFYKVDLFWENLTLKLTLNNQKKVDKLTNNANERIAEMNKVDPEKNLEWIDKLYDEYGVSLSMANDILSGLVCDGKISDEKLAKYQDKIEKTVLNEENIKENVKNKLNQEIVEKVKEVKVDSYLTALPLSRSKEDLKKLNELKLNPGLIIKLQSLVHVSDYTLDEILELDIYKDNKKVKEIDFNKLEQELGLSKEGLIDNLKDFNKVLKEINKDKENNVNNENKDKDKEKLDEIKEKIKDKDENKGKTREVRNKK
ncbi:MAG: hypothetical protein K0Q49_383 [Haloplasmataceae bacterium]|jgi:hypothetical protein|nr:hypothetical protein [Haloplasmataceae bacterium]